MKVLLADDDPDQLNLRALTLEHAGHQTYLAKDEQTAKRLTKQHKPELAVLDLRFPTEVEGLRLIRALRQLDEKLRIVVLTGAGAQQLESKPEHALVEKVLLKGGGSSKLTDYLAGGAAAGAGDDGPRRSRS